MCMCLNCGSGYRHAWVLKVNDTIILHKLLSYLKTRSERIIACFSVCATMVGAGEMIRFCTNSSHRLLPLRQGRPSGFFCCHKTWPLPGMFPDSNSEISPSFLQGASRTQSGCSQINTFSRCITPNWKCLKTACTLTSMRRPMRTRAPSSL